MNKSFKTTLSRSLYYNRKMTALGARLVVSHGGITGSYTSTKTNSTEFYNKQSNNWNS